MSELTEFTFFNYVRSDPIYGEIEFNEYSPLLRRVYVPRQCRYSCRRK